MSAGAEDRRSSSPDLVIGDSGSSVRTDGGGTPRAGPSGDHPQLESMFGLSAKRRRLDGTGKEQKQLQAAVPDELSPFQRLPRELQLVVFSHLSPRELCASVLPVCRQWYELGRDPVLWQHLSFDGRTCSDSNVINILSFSTLLKTLTLKFWRPVGKILLQATESCQQLRSLTVRSCDGLNSLTLKAIVKKCPLIECIDFDIPQLDNYNCLSALTGLQHLKSLNLLHGFPPNQDALVRIARHCTHLQELLVSHPTDAIVQGLVAHAGDRLLSFELGGLHLTDTSYTALGRCRKLQTLRIWCANRMTDDSLPALAGLHGLTRLEISEGYLLSAEALARMFAGQNLPLLTHLDLSYCFNLDDTTVNALTTKYPRLIHLNLSSCQEITNAGLKWITTRLHCLRELELGGCTDVDDEMVNLLTAKYPQLTVLNLSWCEKITSAGIKQIVTRLHCLRDLDLCGVTNVDDEMVNLLTTNCPQLTALDLSWCQKITDDGVELIKTRLHCLRDLQLNCLTDDDR